ncbi:MAG TPA: response regulator transcription factor [Mycobacteriales bacterium]|nr:response regulator transcription factor [Mycobacteriales bacterium]
MPARDGGPGEQSAVRVLIVDDHDVVRHGVRRLIESAPDLNVCAEAADSAAAVSAARTQQPDVAVVDVRLGPDDGIEAARLVREASPGTRVLMLTSYADEAALFAAIMAGAAGYVLKDINGANLLEAIRRVAAGQSLLDPALTNAVLDQLRRRPPAKDGKLARLTAQEERILKLVAEGRTNREIAAEVRLSEKTIKNYVSSILAKLEVGRRSQAAAYLASRSGGGTA